jgi:hypothetical protein
VATCATGPEILAILRDYIEAGGLTCHRVKDDLGGLLDNLDQIFETGMSSTPADDMRDELTLCPDGGTHWAAECDRHECPSWWNQSCPDTAEHSTAECAVHGCPNFIAELVDLAPWGTSDQGLKEWTQ